MSFASILGHDYPKRILRRALAGPRRAHAYLFDGPRGVGKMALAREFAKALLCDERGGGDACGRCRACDRMARGVHPYFLLFAPLPGDRDISIITLSKEAQLDRKIVLKPVGSPYTIICLDEADRLSGDAAGWLLKILEEPPPQTLFLLVTAVPQHLPPTIRSRCQRVRFGPLAPEDALRAAAGGAAGDSGDLEPLLRLADGSPGVALALRKAGAAATLGLLRDAFADLALGRYGERLDAIIKAGDLKKTGVQERERLRLVLGALAEEVAGSLRGDADASPVGAWARRAGPDRALEALERLLQAQREIAWNANSQIVLESVFGALADAARGAP